MAKELKDLTKRSENYSQWYNDLVVKADLAEQSAVRGCMVIKPYGYAIWEKMQRQFILPAINPEIILKPRSRTRRRVCERVCRSNTLSFEECGRRFRSCSRSCS